MVRVGRGHATTASCGWNEVADSVVLRNTPARNSLQPRAMPRGFSGAAAPPPTPTEYEPGARRQPRGLRGQYVQLTPPQHSPVECASSSHSRPSSSAATSEKGSDKSSKASEKRAPLLRPVPRSDASVEKMALAELKELAEQERAKPALPSFPPATEARYAELGGTARLRGWTRTMLPALGAAWALALALSAALLVAPESALAFLTLHAALLAASGAAGAGLLRLASAAGRASFALAVRACDGRASARAQAAAAAARILTLETQLAQAHAQITIRMARARPLPPIPPLTFRSPLSYRRTSSTTAWWRSSSSGASPSTCRRTRRWSTCAST